MKQTKYLMNPGRLSRQDHTLKFTPVDEDGNEGQPRFLPVNQVSDLYVFGSLDANSALYNFLGKEGIAVHFFDYYEHYTGSFMPREYLLAGKMQVEQTKHYVSGKKRIILAKAFVEGAATNILRVLKYYENRKAGGLNEAILTIEQLMTLIHSATDVPSLMGIEGNIRQTYYSCFDAILGETFCMEGRSKRPPQNELNAMISLGNMLCYSACLSMIYHTQLNPTISFLHEPGARRYSLALDMAEIFKPILIDRLIFRMVNKKQLQPSDFRMEVEGCLMKEAARKRFLKEFDTSLKETIKHRSLGRSVSYKHLIKLECYKLQKHLLGIDAYKPFKAWW
ncbi:subtype I-B CRISPR-associated endonuclease Cas1 [Siphonobacter sp. BAB-5385]|uniref:type I-B CRISPR-associated endonuclease Cas1b n=1 Tax=unclassified Siphonobacter TaxID=2635712 RepID=UPI000B9E82FD|nr:MULTISPECIES: type I-B CRISPR-associated endonuclease Cas1b [unclassified Siphonobacter]OZI05905.1 subtype I-B CRISPR-associated endonuclease Cas1 [Siphonobacter sp. BAB-5385]PMD90543.1 subtype I-B CRISPR-associated endonuclease Cas1 [Siphonobacter sp. BAB-5405]